MSAPVHTPYKGGVKGFSIGLHTLDLDDWIEIDDGLAARLAEKEKIRTDHPEETFAADSQSQQAQVETLDLIWDHLVATHPDTHQHIDGQMKIKGITVPVSKNAFPSAPLKTAASLVEEDLCIMSPTESGWCLVAASLCFPSHWSLLEKFGKPMDKIHDPVPGFQGQMAHRVDRIMDNLRPEAPVWRMNWSIHDEPTLFRSKPSEHPRFRGLTGEGIIKTGFVRIERQTLRKLPSSGSILFTIRTHIDPLSSLSMAQRRDLAAAIDDMDASECAYRGISLNAPEVIQVLSPSGSTSDTES